MPNALDQKLSRRSLMQAAGGVTFFALSPSVLAKLDTPGRSGPNATFGNGPLPVFSAMPYLQPGPRGDTLREGQESVVVAWQINNVDATFLFSYGEVGFDKNAEITKAVPPGQGRDQGYRTNYFAELTELKLNRKYKYRVVMNGERLLEGFFTTRKPRGTPIRFVAFGDNSHGDISDRAIAFEAYRARPDFVMNTGDIVYNGGLDNEYGRFFFTVYNAEEANRRTGAPLLRSVPVYTVLGNHDTDGSDEHHHSVANFFHDPDSLGYYTNLYFPENAPEPTHPTPVVGPPDVLDGFKKVAGSRYPKQANYSFDYGDAHFLCLDSNVHVDPTDPALQAWIAEDLDGSDATWKFVVCHHPPFNVGHEHYDEQQMRVLCPIFEKHGVRMVLSGHEHTYQRTRPLMFKPTDTSKAAQIYGDGRFVPGEFTVDREFDGKSQSKPRGIIYITTGAGGKYLYNPDQTGAPGTWLHPEDKNADYCSNVINDRHSLTVFELDAKSLLMRQVDEWGQEIDRIRIDV